MKMHQVDSNMDAAARRKAEMDAKMAARHKEVEGSIQNALHSFAQLQINWRAKLLCCGLWVSFQGRGEASAGQSQGRSQGASESLPSIMAVDVFKGV